MSEVNKIYIVHFLAGFSNIAAVTFTLYFLANGLSQTQIAGLFSVFMISLALFEIPTGGFADTHGHKKSIVLGLLSQSLSFLIFFLYPTYPGFLVGMLLSALGLAFQSGAISSLIYEILHKEKLHETFQKVVGHAGGYFLLGAIFGSTIGSFIFKHDARLPYFLGFACFIIATLIMTRVKWEYVKKEITPLHFINTMKKGMQLTVKNKILMATVLIGIVLSTNRLVYNQNINQPYLINIGVDVAYIGIVAAIASGLLAFVSFNAYRLSKMIGKTMSLIIIVMVPSFTLIALGMINSLIAIPIIYLFLAGHGFRDPVMSHITQEEVDPNMRATMSSTTSFFVSIIVGLIIPYWGKGIDLFGIPTILIYLGMFTILGGGIGFLMYQRSASK